MTTLKGKVKKLHRNNSGQTNGFDIDVKEGGITKTYFAHIGDLKENEDLLYEHEDTVIFREDDEVEFEAWEPNKDRAIRVRKI